MACFDVLDRLVAEGNGYLRTAQVLEHGISKPTLARYVSKRRMERVAHGLYLAQDSWEDVLYQLCLANVGIVFSYETSLFLNGLMEREPEGIDVTVRVGYNATHLRKRGIVVHQVQPAAFDMGVTELTTVFGNAVRTYDMERTMCDMVRNRESLDVQVFRYAMREYMASDAKDLHRLMDYAKRLHVESSMRLYTEVML
ncbi:MAG: type IV toxin-antitoxin system AbiEi family antitoxin domain-containing protein [Coriobacteriales bacterium]|nr:type IV toxin-antitoxin system AbiEi family antitoxin domain-containing protein [Coriobacteriales bacterium]